MHKHIKSPLVVLTVVTHQTKKYILHNINEVKSVFRFLCVLRMYMWLFLLFLHSIVGCRAANQLHYSLFLWAFSTFLCRLLSSLCGNQRCVCMRMKCTYRDNLYLNSHHHNVQHIRNLCFLIPIFTRYTLLDIQMCVYGSMSFAFVYFDSMLILNSRNSLHMPQLRFPINFRLFLRCRFSLIRNVFAHVFVCEK